LKHKPAPIEVSFLPCPRCKIPHHREVPCEQAEVAEIQIRSARSFKKPQATKRVRLSRETRKKINAGDHPQLTFDASIECPVKPGDIIQITALLWIEITKIRRDLKAMRWIIDYIEHNERPRFLRQRTHAADFEAMRERNEGKIDSEKDSAAAEESGYTTSTGSAMSAEPEVVPRDYQQQLTADSRRQHLADWEADQMIIREAISRLRDNPAIKERDSELRFLETQLERIDVKVRRGQATEEAA